MFTRENENTKLLEYIKDVLRYTVMKNPSQESEYDLQFVENGLLLIPHFPITFNIDDAFYTKVFDTLNLALTPQFTLIRPLTMQVVTIPDMDISMSRALLIPLRKGKPTRLVCSFEQLAQRYYSTGQIPLMANLDWDFVKSPHCIVTGVSGSGKSYCLQVLYRLCSLVGETWAIDPKGSDLTRLAKSQNNTNIITPGFVSEDIAKQGIGNDFIQATIKKLKQLEQEMYDRQRRLYTENTSVSADYRNLNLKPIFIFIDELAILGEISIKSIADDFKQTLTRLILLGREAGVYLILAMQAARSEYLPTICRDSISLRIQLGRINSENSKFLFPELSSAIPYIPLGAKGTGIVSIAGDDRYPGIEQISTPTII